MSSLFSPRIQMYLKICRPAIDSFKIGDYRSQIGLEPLELAMQPFQENPSISPPTTSTYQVLQLQVSTNKLVKAVLGNHTYGFLHAGQTLFQLYNICITAETRT